MPSDRPQFNVRLDAVAEKLTEELPAIIEAKMGVTVSKADLIRMALVALAEKLQHPVPKPKKK